MQGKWGIFGQTKKSKKRDLLKAQKRAREKGFDTFRRDYENENIAGIMTGNTGDDTEKTKGYTGNSGFVDFVTTESGLNNPSGFVTQNDVEDYTDYYDPRKEEELNDQYNRDIKTLTNEEELTDKTFQTTVQEKGANLSSGLYGLLTQSKELDSNQNFSGSGDFGEEFANKQLVESAEREANAGQTQVEVDRDRIQSSFEELDANLVSGTQDLHDAYNQEFWNNITKWESTVNA